MIHMWRPSPKATEVPLGLRAGMDTVAAATILSVVSFDGSISRMPAWPYAITECCGPHAACPDCRSVRPPTIVRVRPLSGST
jgi:hypothetical protein